jgi:hypothetical protein
MVKLATAILVVLLLTGCIAPPRDVRDIVAPKYKLYLPLATNDLHRAANANNKRGLNLACGSYVEQTTDIAQLNVGWIWNWNTQPPLFPGVESIPTIWGRAQINEALGGNSPWLLGFNEPDISDQANLAPEEAARLWLVVEQLHPDKLLTSPQVMYHYNNWLEQFYAAFIAQNGRPPRMNAIAIHTYIGNNAASYIADVQRYIKLARQWNIPEVWVTEWALGHNLDRTLRATTDEMHKYLAYLDNEPMVTRYAPWTNRVDCMIEAFGFRYDGPFDTPLINRDGSISELGKAYRDAQRP